MSSVGGRSSLPGVAVVLGTRPDPIKPAPVVRVLSRDHPPTRVMATGQHREPVRQKAPLLGVRIDADLDIIRFASRITTAAVHTRVLDPTRR